MKPSQLTKSDFLHTVSVVHAPPGSVAETVTLDDSGDDGASSPWTDLDRCFKKGNMISFWCSLFYYFKKGLDLMNLKTNMVRLGIPYTYERYI